MVVACIPLAHPRSNYTHTYTFGANSVYYVSAHTCAFRVEEISRSVSGIVTVIVTGDLTIPTTASDNTGRNKHVLNQNTTLNEINCD